MFMNFLQQTYYFCNNIKTNKYIDKRGNKSSD